MDATIPPTRADRDRTLDSLRDGLSAGLLTPEEFKERHDAALIVRTVGELHALVLGLPYSSTRKNERVPRQLKLALGVAALVVGLLVIVAVLVTIHPPAH